MGQMALNVQVIRLDPS